MLDEIVQGSVGRAYGVANLPERALVGSSDHHGTGRISEKHAGRTVGKVGTSGKRLRGDKQHHGFGVSGNRVSRKLKAIDKAGACGIEVQAHDVAHAARRCGNAELAGNKAGRTGAKIVGSAGGNKNMGDFFRRSPASSRAARAALTPQSEALTPSSRT